MKTSCIISTKIGHSLAISSILFQKEAGARCDYSLRLQWKNDNSVTRPNFRYLHFRSRAARCVHNGCREIHRQWTLRKRFRGLAVETRILRIECHFERPAERQIELPRREKPSQINTFGRSRSPAAERPLSTSAERLRELDPIIAAVLEKFIREFSWASRYIRSVWPHQIIVMST